MERRDRAVTEPWSTLPLSVLQSPSPDRTRSEVQQRVLGDLASLIGDTTGSRRHATAVACQLVGLAEGIRALGFFPAPETPAEDLVALYSPSIQRHIDACG